MESVQPEEFSTEKNPCSCTEMMHLVLDGEASSEQLSLFRQHLSDCPQCHGRYEVHAVIQRMVRDRCCDAPPDDLEDQIWSKIKSDR